MTKTARTLAAAGMIDMFAHLPFGPKITFAPEDGTGTGDAGADDATAKAAEAAAAEEAAKKELEEAEAAAAAAEDDGKDKAALAAEKRDLLREVMDKKAKLKDAEKKAADAAAALAAYGGVDPEKVKELLKKESDAENAALEARGDFDRLKTKMAEEHANDVKAKDAEISELRSQLAAKDSTIADLTVGNDFSGSTYIREQLTLSASQSRKLYEGHFEVQDGRTVAFDKPKGAANRTMMVDASGNPLVFDAAFQRIIEADPDKERLVKAKIAPGSSSNTVTGKVDPKTLTPKFTSGVDRIRASFGG